MADVAEFMGARRNPSLDMSSGQAAFARKYGSAPAWHNLGAEAPAGATMAEWLAAAHLDFAVDTVPVAFKPNGHWAEATEHRAVVRRNLNPADQTAEKGHGSLFQIASNRFKPLQPVECVMWMWENSERYGMPLETLGALHSGAQIFALATNYQGFKIKGDDEIKPYLLSTTSYDSSFSRTWKFVAERAVCRNTVTIGLAEDGGVVKVRNTSRHDGDAIRQRLGMAADYMAAFEQNANRLAEEKPKRSTVDKLLFDLFGKAEDPDKPMTRDGSGNLINFTTQSRNVIADVERCIVASPGSGMDSARGTAWGVLNGVTRYVDFEARARSTDNRLESAWFGKGDKLKSDAMAFLLQECVGSTAGVHHSSLLDAAIAGTRQ